MLDHVGLLVSDYERSKRFFTDALSAIGYTLLMEHEISGAGFGRGGKALDPDGNNIEAVCHAPE